MNQRRTSIEVPLYTPRIFEAISVPVTRARTLLDLTGVPGYPAAVRRAASLL